IDYSENREEPRKVRRSRVNRRKPTMPDARPAQETDVDDPQRLKRTILRVLRRQGFTYRNGSLAAPPVRAKEDIRRLHRLAVEHRRESARPYLEEHESVFLSSIANGVEVDPVRIAPALIRVQRRSADELLFRYLCLQWSIPVSSGYGRRLRFL